MRARSPQQVHALLSSIESREAALQQKVQQLTEEKAMQQKRLEDEVARLQRSNARMEEELRTRKHAGVPELETFEGGQYARTRVERRDESPRLPQDVREDLQQQLFEIRAEVTRCAQALYGPEALPASEVVDIRQQLAALSNEVVQTSRALLEPGGFPEPACPNEVPETGGSHASSVRRQLEGLQGQVSRAAHASFAHPTVDTQAGRVSSPQHGELSELRAEVDALRAMVAQALRRDAAPTTTTDVFPQTVGPEVSALNGRLAALRTEVARVVQGHRLEDMTSPTLRAQLGALLQELQDVRTGAAAIAAAAADGAGPQGHRLHALPAPEPGLPYAAEAWQARQLGSPRPVPTPSRCSGRNCDPSRFVDVDLGTPEWASRVARSSQAAAQLPPVQPVLGVHSPPLLLCPHLAADLAAVSGRCGYSDTADFPGKPVLQHASAGVAAGGPAVHGVQRPLSGSSFGPGRSIAAVTGVAPQHLPPPRSWDQPGDVPAAPHPCGAALGSVVPGGQGSLSAAVAGSVSCPWTPQAAWCGGAGVAMDVGGPPEEPADHAPQGAMLRPLRTKIPRSEGAW